VSPSVTYCSAFARYTICLSCDLDLLLFNFESFLYVHDFMVIRSTPSLSGYFVSFRLSGVFFISN